MCFNYFRRTIWLPPASTEAVVPSADGWDTGRNGVHLSAWPLSLVELHVLRLWTDIVQWSGSAGSLVLPILVDLVAVLLQTLLLFREFRSEAPNRMLLDALKDMVSRILGAGGGIVRSNGGAGRDWPTRSSPSCGSCGSPSFGVPGGYRVGGIWHQRPLA